MNYRQLDCRKTRSISNCSTPEIRKPINSASIKSSNRKSRAPMSRSSMAERNFTLSMDDDFDNILDGALAAGADLPFACKGGVCSTCKCRVVEGSVEMKINYALDENEVAKNYILSCQAVPTSQKVVVDFGG
jgi:ferredoxin